MLKDPDYTLRRGLIIEDEAHLNDAEDASSDESISEQSVDLYNKRQFVVTGV